MALQHLACKGFRNLAPVELDFSPQLNQIIGPNGSGKTSLLEAIYFLGRARSFRTHRLHHLIQTDNESLLVRGTVDRQDGRRVHVGIQRSRQKQEIRLGGQPLRQLADLVAWFPIQIMNPDSHRLLEDGPGKRRQFLDWGVFHVKHHFFPVWQQFSRTLKQRNAALRAGSPVKQIQVWDEALIQSAQEIDQLRRQYLEQLEPYLMENLALLVDLPGVRLRYQAGWPKELDYPAALERGLESDQRQGFTHAGPHRADLRIDVEGVPAIERVSRGQQKQLITAMLLAQAQLYQETTGNPCMFLIDDLPAELDPEHRGRVLDCLHRLSAQIFVTATDEELLPAQEWAEKKMFHVKHGQVQEMVY